jgi:hypothetical protein
MVDDPSNWQIGVKKLSCRRSNDNRTDRAETQGGRVVAGCSDDAANLGGLYALGVNAAAPASAPPWAIASSTACTASG